MVGASVAGPVRTVGIVGGTGKLGTALAARFASAGLGVVIGSRAAARASEVAATLRAGLPAVAGPVSGAANSAAGSVDGVVIIAVPYDGLDAILTDLAPSIGRHVVVSAVVPMRFDGPGGATAVPVPEGSACEQIAARLPAARVVGAMQTLSHVAVRDLDRSLDSDVILTGDDDAAKAIVAELLTCLRGVRVVDGGGLRNSRFVEQLTVLLVAINGRYRRHAGVRITDLPDDVVAARDAAAP